MGSTNIRNAALSWFNTHYPLIEGPVLTSKFYSPQESWSNSRVWFFQIPLNLINPNQTKYLHLICENHLSGESFLYLKVSTLFILKHEKDFEVDQEKKVMRIYLSAEAVDMYKEVRKESKIDFGSFVQLN